MKFIADNNVGQLARWLRMAGYAAESFAGTLQGLFSLSLDQLAAALQAAGFVFSEVGKALESISGNEARILAALKKAFREATDTILLRYCQHFYPSCKVGTGMAHPGIGDSGKASPPSCTDLFSSRCFDCNRDLLEAGAMPLEIYKAWKEVLQPQFAAAGETLLRALRCQAGDLGIQVDCTPGFGVPAPARR